MEHWTDKPGCIRTVTGRYVSIANPQAEQIDLEDIAHGLANTMRWGGHTLHPYSVAQHSMEVAKRCERPHALAALLHDASEAYLCDLPTPLKSLLPDYKAIEARFMRVIFDRFGVPYPLHESVSKADADALQWEWEAVMIAPKGGFHYEPSNIVALQFLESFSLYSPN